MNEFFRRLRYLLNRRRMDQELADDMEFHREMAAREGNTNFGNTLRLREEARDAWGWTWLDRFSQDLRYGARLLLKSPGFTAAAVLMLAAGIGVNVAAFGFFNLVFIRPLPVRDPDTIMRYQRRGERDFASHVPHPWMVFYREHSRTLSAVLALNAAPLTLEAGEKLGAHFVTANFFEELGAAPKLGRMLDPARDEAPGAEPAVVLGHGFWQRRFGADPGIVGRTLRLNGKPVTVIGVAAKEFSGLTLATADIWLSLTQHPYLISGSDLLTDSSGRDGVQMWGRLGPGVSPKAADEELRSVAAELRRQYPAATWKNEGLFSEPGGHATKGGQSRGSSPPKTVREEVFPVFALVGTLVLLILAVACANLGSLLLARGVARERELAIRAAVGAGKRRLVRQLFTESVLLALVGSIAGLALGYVVLRCLMVFTEAPLWLDPTPDWRVVLFALAAGFTAAILFGLAPALQVARQRHRATIMRQVLIGAQVAASCVLMIVAGLLVRALDHAISTDPGFEYQQVVSIEPRLANHGYSSGAAWAYLEGLRNRLGNLPGVESVSLATVRPLGNTRVVTKGEADGRSFSIHINRVTPQFFETMKIPLLRGRNLMPGDTKALIISESFARRQWPAEDPVGKLVPMGQDSTGAELKYTVVGVSRSARLVALQDPDAVEAYQLLDAAGLTSAVVLVRMSGPPEGVTRSMASMAKSLDAKLLPEVQTLKSSFRKKLKPAEQSALAIGLLGLVALLLACAGIAGVVAYAVSRRVKEIGIRMALGASPVQVLTVILLQFARPVLAGLALGACGAAGLSQLLRRELYGISNLDPVAYLAATGLFILTVAVAALVPARRALRVDPMRALRYE